MSPQYMNPASRMAYYAEVWEMVRQIPVGCVATYGQIASLIYPPEGTTPQAYKAFGPRWVGGAMAACPDDVPWQRVINSQGKISLRRGEGQTHQRELLEAEGIIFDERERVDLSRFKWSGPENK
jgi:methylated-DNA-protein-cysteine methyltransferase-like protein